MTVFKKPGEISERYQEKFAVLDDEKLDIVRQVVLARSGGVRHQVVVVNKIVATNSDENKCLVHKLLGTSSSYECSHSLLVLLEELILSVHSYYIYLQKFTHHF